MAESAVESKVGESPGSAATLVIAPSRGWSRLGLAEVWEYRELLYFLLWREVKGKYRQMAFGPLWIIIQPLVNMVILSLIFGVLAKLPSEDLPYPLFTYVAVLPWQFFARATATSAESLLSQRQLIAKVYFPRLLIPITAVLSALVDFAASFVVLIGLMAFYRVVPTWKALTLPAFLVLAGGVALGVGLWLACLAVKFHDVALGLNFSLTIWQYLSPVAYSTSLIPGRWQMLYRLNPLSTVLDGFRWALLGAKGPPAWAVVLTMLLVLLLLALGTLYFRRTERTIVDLI